MARGVGAFIEGAFGGYGWGEDLKNNRADRRRRDRLDEISEEQRAIDNQRNDLRDRILQDEHAYNQTIRDQALADEQARRDAIAAGVAAADGAVQPAATSRPDSPSVTVGPAATTSNVVPIAPTTVMPGGAGNTAPGGGAAPAVAPRGAMAQSGSQTTVDLATAIAAAEELVRRAEQSRDPQAYAAAVAARDALYAQAAAERAAQGQQPPDGRTANDDRAIIAARVAAAEDQQPQPTPTPAERRPVLTDPGPLSPAGGPRTVAGPPPVAPGREQFIPSTSMIPSPRPAPRGIGMAFGETPVGSMPPAAGSVAADMARREQLVTQAQPPARPTGPEPFIPGPPPPGQTREPVVNPMRAVGQPGPRGVPISEVMPPVQTPFDPNGQTREPLVNPMRAVGTGGIRGVPISTVMPPAAREQVQTSAPAAADRLEQSRTASGALIADVMRGPAGGPAPRGALPPLRGPAGGPDPTQQAANMSTPPTPRGAKQMPQEPNEWVDTFVDVGVPVIEEQLLRAGRPDLAAEWRTWADSQVARQGYEAYARAGLAAARGDISGFADAIQTLYDSPYMPDGWETDRKASQFMQDSEGNIVGAQIVLRNTETGEMRVENYETIDELVSDLLMTVSPEAAFQAHIAQQQAARERVITQAAEAEADATATAEAIREQLKVLEESRGLDPTWQQMTPEQKVAEAAAIVRAAASAAGQAPRGTTPGAPPPAATGAALPDWTG